MKLCHVTDQSCQTKGVIVENGVGFSLALQSTVYTSTVLLSMYVFLPFFLLHPCVNHAAVQ